MSVVQSGSDLGLASLSPEFKKSEESANLANIAKLNELTEAKKQQETNAIEEAAEANQGPLAPEQLEKVAQELQEFVGELNRGLEFSVDKDSGRDVIKVIDKSSGDLVKQFPSEEVLTLVAKLSEMTGGLVDAKV